MRKEGLGYKKIAKTLKMHRDSVRDFVRETALTDWRQNIRSGQKSWLRKEEAALTVV